MLRDDVDRVVGMIAMLKCAYIEGSSFITLTDLQSSAHLSQTSFPADSFHKNVFEALPRHNPSHHGNGNSDPSEA